MQRARQSKARIFEFWNIFIRRTKFPISLREFFTFANSEKNDERNAFCNFAR